MGARKTDRRVARTREALSGALISLMGEKKYDAITVEEILGRANVGRSTFYLHFRDKDALLSHGFQNLNQALHATMPGVAGSGAYESILGFAPWMFQHAHEHRVLYRSLVGTEGLTVFSRNMEETLGQILKRQTQLYKRKAGSEVPLELLVHFLLEAFLSTLSWWLKRKPTIPPEALHSMFRSLTEPIVIAHLKRSGTTDS